MTNAAEDSPGETTTVSGALSTEGELLRTMTFAPAAGAGPLMNTFPVRLLPALIVASAGDMFVRTRYGSSLDTVIVSNVPVTVAPVPVAVETTEAVNTAVVAPAGMVTEL